MTGSDDFLARWSRRKRAVKAEESSPPSRDATGKSAQPASDHPAGPDNPPAKQPDPAFDLSKLPSLDSIGPETDIRMFMQPGVPAALSRAALRHAWSADPAIRDFIGLSENSWDFNAPDSIVGFGPLAPTDNVKRLLAQVFNDEPTQPAEPVSGSGDVSEADAARTRSEDAPAPVAQLEENVPPQENANPISAIDPPERELLQCDNNNAAQQTSDSVAPRAAHHRRKHGGALPT
jgi:hypothetical protein